MKTTKKQVTLSCLFISSAFWFACSSTKTAQCCQSPSSEPQSTISAGGGVANANLAIDLEATSVVVGSDEITLTAKVHNIGPDDCSGETKIIVLLPRESEVLSFSARDEDGNSLPISQCLGYLCCTVERYGLCLPRTGSEAPEFRHDVFITVRTRPSPKPVSPLFGVIAYGTTPESDMSNNFWCWR